MTHVPEPTPAAAPAPVKHRRPTELIIAVGVCHIAGFIQILAGIGLIFLRYVPGIDEAERFAFTVAGAVTILIGLLSVTVASGLTRARPEARILTTVLMSLSILTNALPIGDDLTALGLTTTLSVIAGTVIVLLWTGRIARFFAHNAGVLTELFQ